MGGALFMAGKATADAAQASRGHSPAAGLPVLDTTTGDHPDQVVAVLAVHRTRKQMAGKLVLPGKQARLLLPYRLL